ncbi:hypothetical protein OG379_41250 (plasmid) [Streptomyces sp. NBC_01166]|uniref:hypothetical protein n=1 Tax=Streptomyces sp. NBC_01166 TaxID=2903755 RepID=UPI003864667C|nr:hypothetical protein OG379_41250 [Streptomyces sp. NBC_01166]
MNSLASALDTPRAGLADDMTEDDNDRGFERDETDKAFRRLVDHMVVDGDDRARSAGRQARRTLAEMDPGYERQPVLLLTRPLTFRSANSACPMCDRFNCPGHDCPPSATPAPAENSGQLQCDRCSQWFGFTGWTCSACQALGLTALPMRPTPHERDGRTEPPPAPARPHSTVSERHQP